MRRHACLDPALRGPARVRADLACRRCAAIRADVVARAVAARVTALAATLLVDRDAPGFDYAANAA